MPVLPTWLTTLQRVREQRRDVAWQSLVASVRAVTEAHAATAEVAENLSRLRETQQQLGLAGRFDPERLRRLREDREDQRSQLADAQRRQSEAEARLHQAQSEATAKETDVEILRRLSDRLLASQRFEQHRQYERSAVEESLSLCNERRGG